MEVYGVSEPEYKFSIIDEFEGQSSSEGQIVKVEGYSLQVFTNLSDTDELSDPLDTPDMDIQIPIDNSIKTESAIMDPPENELDETSVVTHGKTSISKEELKTTRNHKKTRRKINNSRSAPVSLFELRKCLTCKESMPLRELITHIREHVYTDQRQCNFCQKVYCSADLLRSHIYTHYGLEPYKCSACGVTYSLKQSLVNHIVRHHDAQNTTAYISSLVPMKKKLTCTTCPSKFMSSEKLTEHEAAIHGNHRKGRNVSNIVVVPDVDSELTKRKTSKTVKELKVKSILKKPPRKINNSISEPLSLVKHWKCLTCEESMPLRYLLHHVRDHVMPDQRQCDFCQQVYCTTELLRSHIYTHYGLEPYKCTVCGVTYSLKQSLMNHIIRIHNSRTPANYISSLLISDKLWTCMKCPKKFEKRQGALKHMKLHHDYDPNQKCTETDLCILGL